MINKIKAFAKSDANIRAVVLNGSRANKTVTPDPYQDYDVTFIVQDVEPFRHHIDWITTFGTPLIKQINPHPAEKKMLGDFTDGFIVMVHYENGVRLDMSFDSVDTLDPDAMDSLSVVVLDKDKALTQIPVASDRDYRLKKPNPEDFDLIVNDFLWCSLNVVKGILRKETLYVKGMLDQVVRQRFLWMAAWYAGACHDWQINTGAFHKWLPQYLDAVDVAQYNKTFCGPTAQENTAALLALHALFHRYAKAVSNALNFAYDEKEAMAVLKRIKEDLT